jgi:hypothetical protein
MFDLFLPLNEHFTKNMNCIACKYTSLKLQTTVEPLITDTAGEFKFCPL